MKIQPISYEEAERRYLTGGEQPIPARGQYWYLAGRKSPILVALYLEPYIYTADISNSDPILSAGVELGKVMFGAHQIKEEGGNVRYIHNVMFYAPLECIE